MLYEDQIQAVKEIIPWHDSSKPYHILNGPAGVGKTHVIDELLRSIPRIKPLLLAPTHKAVNNFRDKVHGEYEYKTVASALGIRPVDEGRDLVFKHTQISPIWGKTNLCIIDEAGMLDDQHLNILTGIGTKILFVGHGSQLPPVKKNRSVHDKCISPVYQKGYSQSELWIPKRNVGVLWDFCNLVEKKIYNKEIIIPTNYDIGRDALEELLTESKNAFQEGSMKFALWSNECVTKYNARIRESIFGKVFEKYIPGDLIVVTKSFISIEFLEVLSEKKILENLNIGQDIYTDTDCKVVHCRMVEVKLNKILALQCYKITVDSPIEGRFTIFELLHKDDYKRIADYYEHIAWSYKTKEAKDKAYKVRAQLLSVFTQVKHFYASTCHRLQGSSIDSIIVGTMDIAKNSNVVERAKLDYVATSRAKNNLYRYRGL